MCPRLPAWVAPAVLFAAAALIHCLPPLPPGPKPACEKACERLVEFGCSEGAPSAGGVPCLDVCVSAVASGVDLEPECVARAEDADAVRRCGVRCDR